MKYSWQSLNDLLATCDGAVYIVDIAAFQANVGSFLKAFRRFYSNTQLGYSYKTNYLPRLCVEADRLGMYAEVVSGMEYDIAVACGVREERIIFNGPVKSRAEMMKAFIGGALVNVDSLGEAHLVAEVASGIDREIRVGLRCNLGVKWQGRTSRFGLSDINGDLAEAKRVLAEVPNLTLAGIHCHFSYDRSAKSYQLRAQKMKELATSLFVDRPPQFIDLGGGFCGPMPDVLRKQFSAPPPDVDEYASAITEVLIAEYGKEDAPELILEPGVGLVANVVDYACRVEHVKSVPDRHIAVTAGATQDIKIVPNDFNPPLQLLTEPVPSDSGVTLPVDFVGFTCLEHDLIYHGYEGRVRAGDIAIFGSTGAYSMVTSPSFIRTSPPVVMITESGAWEVLKDKQSVDQLLSLFHW